MRVLYYLLLCRKIIKICQTEEDDEALLVVVDDLVEDLEEEAAIQEPEDL